MEDKARELLADKRSKPYDSSIISLIEQEIALTLEQIDRLRSLHQNQLYSLSQANCYINTELMQMEARTPRYSPYRFPERDKLQHRLFAVESERRRESVFYEGQIQGLQRRLLSLMQKHRQLDIQNSLKDLHLYVRK